MLRVFVLSMLLALPAGLALAGNSVQVAMSSQDGPRNLSVEKPLQFGGMRETQNPVIYIYGQFMKFVRRGALRAESSLPEMRTFSNMVFVNPDGRAVLVAVNSSHDTQPFAARCGGKMFDGELPGGTMATYSWKKMISVCETAPRLSTCNQSPGFSIILSQAKGSCLLRHSCENSILRLAQDNRA